MHDHMHEKEGNWVLASGCEKAGKETATYT